MKVSPLQAAAELDPGESFGVRFGRHLQARKDALVERWLAHLRARRDIPSADPLPTCELVNHIPELFELLTQTLGCAHEHHNPEAMARTHGGHRWRQGFRLDELIREITEFRGLVIGEIDALGATPAEQAFAAGAVRDFFDNLTIGSVREYIDERERVLEEVNAALVAASNRATSLADARLKLLRTVSHELRNAAGALANATALLAEAGHEPDTRAECVAMLQRNLGDMTALLNGLLDYSASLADGAPPRPEPLDLAAFERELANAFEPTARAKGLQFHAHLDPTLGPVVTDRLKLKQIATNLLSNAIKFTAHGGVHLEFRAVNGERWAVRVRDTGRGITSANQRKLFHEFERLDAEDAPGTGLGLAIVRRLALQLGGDIAVESVPGEGSIFEARLPRVLAG